MAEPLTFADFLPDDRSPERKRVDALRGEIAAFLRSDDSRQWLGWQQFLLRQRADTAMDKAMLDLALRKELVSSRRHAPPKPVLGLLFTEMDWWEPKGGYAKRDAELRELVELFGIGHLRPHDTEPKPFDGELFDQPHSLKWVVWGVFLLMLVLVLAG